MNAKLLPLLLGLGITFSAPLAAQEPVVVDRVIATVGGELLLLSELQEQLALLRDQQNVEITDEVRCTVLEQLLTGKLLVNQAKLDSVEVTNDEVDAQLDARFDRILGMMNNDLEQFEQYYRQTVNQVRAQFREDLRAQLLSERKRAEIVNSARITPSEVVAFYEQIPQDSLPYFNSEVEFRELVMRPEVSATERQRALDRIEEIRSQLQAGADFAELARKNSDDIGSGRAGGELGWAKRGSFVPEFEAAAYRLEKGELSDVVETQYGFHLIELLDRRGNQVRTRHILIKPEIVQADLDATVQKLDSVRHLVLEDSLLFRQAVARFGDENVQSYNNAGRVINPASGNTFFETSDIDPVAFFAIDTLEVGGITAPIEFEQPNTYEKYYKIYQLDSRSVPHQASLELDYNKIKNAATEAKRNDILRDWVTKTIRSTFIQVDRGLVRDCGLEERWFTNANQRSR